MLFQHLIVLYKHKLPKAVVKSLTVVILGQQDCIINCVTMATKLLHVYVPLTMTIYLMPRGNCGLFIISVS